MKRATRREERIAPPMAANLYRSLVEEDHLGAGTNGRGSSLKAMAARNFRFHRNAGVRIHALPARG